MFSGALTWAWVLLLITAQIASAIIGAGFETCMLPGPIAVIIILTNRTFASQGLSIEAFLTPLLVFVVLMLAAETNTTAPLQSQPAGSMGVVSRRACREQALRPG